MKVWYDSYSQVKVFITDTDDIGILGLGSRDLVARPYLDLEIYVFCYALKFDYSALSTQSQPALGLT